MTWQGKDTSWQWALGEWRDGIEHRLGQERWTQVWESWAEANPHVLQEEVIAPYYQILPNFVVTYVDQHPGEGLII